MDISLSDIFYIGGGLLLLAFVSILFTHRNEIAQATGNIMASLPQRAQKTIDTNAVYIPVNQTGMAGGMDDDDSEMPRIGRALSDQEIVILLAVQRRAGKYRFSANDIYTLVKGDRNNVLRWVRELRDGAPPAEYRSITPEQQAQREALGLAR